MRPLNIFSAVMIAVLSFTACDTPQAPQKNNPIPTLTNEIHDSLMVLVKGGTFTMGCTSEQGNECQDDEKITHQVTLNDFYIGKYEVTVAQFARFIADSNYITDADRKGTSEIWKGSTWEYKKGVNWKCDAKGNIRPKTEANHPVIHVSWNDAVAYCQWLHRKTGKKYRLLTEAEWEYAAKGGNQSQIYKYSGSNAIETIAWYYANSANKTHRVGTKKPNELGIYDMSGNVWEWCMDKYNSYSSQAVQNPTGATTGGYRVGRGGSWGYGADYCRTAFRFHGASSLCHNHLGFRLCLPL